MRWRDFSALSCLCLWLAGCATAALDMAPERPDRPWAPAVDANGEIIAGKKGSANTAGYVLPANPALAKIPAPPPLDKDRAYSLPELIDLAESNNPLTRIAWNDARRAALAAGIAESAYLPRITAGAIAGHQRGRGHYSSGDLGLDNDVSVNGTVSAVSLQWLLFDFGERAAVVDAAKQASVIANIAFTGAHQQLIYDVTLAFYQHAAARARLATATGSLKNAQLIQTAAEERYRHGVGTVMEAAQARQGEAQANLAVVKATGEARDTYLALLSAMGISTLTHIEIADVSGRKLSPDMAAPVEAIVAQSLARRPDVQSAYAAEKASQAGIRAAQADFMPKFFVSATSNYNTGNLDVTALPAAGPQPSTVNIGNHRFSNGVFAGVTMPLYDGGMRSAALAQARAEADSAQARLARVQEEAVRQIVRADNALRTSLSAYSASQSLQDAAQTTFDAALAAYRNGIGSITELTLAETQLLQAKNAATDAYSVALSAAATLAFATGALGGPPL